MCLCVRSWAQEQKPEGEKPDYAKPDDGIVWPTEKPSDWPDGVEWPPAALKELFHPTVPLPPLPPLPPLSEEKAPGQCPPDKHWGPGPDGCVDGAPNMGVTETAGIPYEEALAIFERHQDELFGIPGLMGGGLGIKGIYLAVLPTHGNVPAAVEGLPIQTEPYLQPRLMRHTEATRVRPFHGGVLSRPIASTLRADWTMTTVVLAHGDPWIIFAAHCLSVATSPLNCPVGGTLSHCPLGTPLWQYPRYPGANTLTVCDLNALSQCMATMTGTLNRKFNVGDVVWFLVAVQGQGQAVNLDPFYNRVYLRLHKGFDHPNGLMIGAAGLSVTTS